MKRFLGKRGGAKNWAACALAVDARTTLVPIGRADAPAVFRLVERNRAGLVPWMPWARDATAVTTEAFVAEAVAAAQSGSGFHFTLWCANEPVGAFGLHQIDPQRRSAQMGYWLDAGAAGRGLATGASRRLLTWAFGDLGLERSHPGWVDLVRIEPLTAFELVLGDPAGERPGVDPEVLRHLCHRLVRLSDDPHRACAEVVVIASSLLWGHHFSLADASTLWGEPHFSNIGLWGTRSGSNCCRRKSPRCFQLAETRREDY